MNAAEKLALLSAGIFFLNGLLTGVWKYQQIRTSPNAQAHPYVDIAHRTSLLYAFAALLLQKFVEVSDLPDAVELGAVAAQVLFFAAAIASYMVHGFLQDTDNQLRRPHTLGRSRLPGGVISGFMWALVLAEVGGFVTLLYGVARHLMLN